MLATASQNRDTGGMDDAQLSLLQAMQAMGSAAREASGSLREAAAEDRTGALLSMARRVREHSEAILAANEQDLENAADLPAPMRDRLTLDPARIEAMAIAVEQVAAVPDPVGRQLAGWTRPNGLEITRVSVPIGVIAMIYEARPNVTADAAALSIRSGNAAILRCGSECLATSLAIHAALAEGLADAGLPETAVQMVRTADRAAVGMILEGLDGAVDLVIPRGGKGLVERVQREARVAVLGHADGVNHVYVHAAANPEKARAIVLNAKMRRVSAAPHTETRRILAFRTIARAFSG